MIRGQRSEERRGRLSLVRYMKEWLEEQRIRDEMRAEGGR